MNTISREFVAVCGAVSRPWVSLECVLSLERPNGCVVAWYSGATHPEIVFLPSTCPSSDCRACRDPSAVDISWIVVRVRNRSRIRRSCPTCLSIGHLPNACAFGRLLGNRRCRSRSTYGRRWFYESWSMISPLRVIHRDKHIYRVSSCF